MFVTEVQAGSSWMMSLNFDVEGRVWSSSIHPDVGEGSP